VEPQISAALDARRDELAHALDEMLLLWGEAEVHDPKLSQVKLSRDPSRCLG